MAPKIFCSQITFCADVGKIWSAISNSVFRCHCPRTTDTQWRHKLKISEKLGRCGRQNMLRPYLKIWEWEWIFGRAGKAISSLGVRSPCHWQIARSADAVTKLVSPLFGQHPNCAKMVSCENTKLQDWNSLLLINCVCWSASAIYSWFPLSTLPIVTKLSTSLLDSTRQHPPLC